MLIIYWKMGNFVHNNLDILSQNSSGTHNLLRLVWVGYMRKKSKSLEMQFWDFKRKNQKDEKLYPTTRKLLVNRRTIHQIGGLNWKSRPNVQTEIRQTGSYTSYSIWQWPNRGWDVLAMLAVRPCRHHPLLS